MSESSEYEVVTPFEEARPWLAALRSAGQSAFVMAEVATYMLFLAFLHTDGPTLYQVAIVLLIAFVVLSLFSFGVSYFVHKVTRRHMFPRRINYDPLTDTGSMTTPHYTHEFSLIESRWTFGSTIQETHGEFLRRSKAILLEVGKQENDLAHIVSLPEGRAFNNWQQMLELKGVQDLRPYRQGERVLLPSILVQSITFGCFLGLLVAWGICEVWTANVGPPPRPEVIYWLFLLIGMCLGSVFGVREGILEAPVLTTSLGFMALFLAFGIPLAMRADDIVTKIALVAAFTVAPAVCSAFLLMWRRRNGRLPRIHVHEE